MVLEKTLESPLDCKEIKPVNPEGNQSWIFIGTTDGKAETPILWPPGVKNWLIRKDTDAGQDWRKGEKGIIEDETVGWYHRFDGHEFEQAPEVGEQGNLPCCSPWGCKESDTTERLNWTKLLLWWWPYERGQLPRLSRWTNHGSWTRCQVFISLILFSIWEQYIIISEKVEKILKVF